MADVGKPGRHGGGGEELKMKHLSWSHFGQKQKKLIYLMRWRREGRCRSDGGVSAEIDICLSNDYLARAGMYLMNFTGMAR